MPDRWELSEEAAQQIARGLRKINGMGMPRTTVSHRHSHATFNGQGIGVYNTTGETIPAFGVMRIVSATTLGDEMVYIVGKQSTEFQRFMLVNGAEELTSNDPYGTGYFLDIAGRALYDSSDGTPAYGQIWGPYPDSWKLRRHMYGFRILGDVSTNDGHVRCDQHLLMVGIKGKTDSSHAKSATGTVSVWKGDHSADSGANISSVYNSFATLATTKWCNVQWCSETPDLYSGEC